MRARKRVFGLALNPARKRLGAAGLAAAAGTLALSVFFASPRAAASPPSPPGKAFAIALTGDTIVTRALRSEKGAAFESLLRILRDADAAVTNLETLFHDYEGPAIPPGLPSMRSDPALAKDLAWAGFDLASRANNHAGDYGVPGMTRTTSALAAAGIGSAGVGPDLAHARAAAYFQTPGGKTLALVSAASYFPEPSRASAGRGPVPPRPGLSPLRHETTYVLTAPRMQALKAAAAELGMPAGDDPNEARLFDCNFVVGSPPGVRTAPSRTDLDGITAAIRSARTRADWVLFSLHAHEGMESDRRAPAAFVVAAAHAAIDAGADAVFGHGPHILRGIEVYRGKPILYSLGNFVFEYETIRDLPSDEYERLGLPGTATVADFFDKQEDFGRFSYPAERESWDSVVAVLHGTGRTLDSVELDPVTLGFGQPRGVRGAPRLASPADAARILADLARLSKPFGTTIEVRGTTGFIRLGRSTPIRN